MIHEEFTSEHKDPLVRFLHQVIRFSLKLLLIFMVVVILLGVVDVLYVVYQRMMAPPLFLISVNDIFQILGAFMVVLIAIEVFVNIRLYLGTEELPVQLVIATALMAIARKVIILDLETIEAPFVYAIAAVVLALGLTYWLLSNRTSRKIQFASGKEN